MCAISFVNSDHPFWCVRKKCVNVLKMAQIISFYSAALCCVCPSLLFHCSIFKISFLCIRPFFLSSQRIHKERVKSQLFAPFAAPHWVHCVCFYLSWDKSWLVRLWQTELSRHGPIDVWWGTDRGVKSVRPFIKLLGNYCRNHMVLGKSNWTSGDSYRKRQSLREPVLVSLCFLSSLCCQLNSSFRLWHIVRIQADTRVIICSNSLHRVQTHPQNARRNQDPARP